MAKILWISDAGTPTGFGKVTHEIAERLVGNGHDIHVLAVGWDARFPVDSPLKLYRAAAGPSHNYLGLDRMREVVQIVQPDVIVTLEDAQMVLKRFYANPWDAGSAVRELGIPTIAYLPVDGVSIPPAWLELKNDMTVVPMSRFGAQQLDLPYFVYHGVDTAVFHPVGEAPLVSTAGILRSKAECRRAFGMDETAFIVGRVDSNSGRKDWASTWKAIDWGRRHGLPGNTVAAFHTMVDAPSSGVNLNALISKGEGDYMVTNAVDWPERDVAAFINCFDVAITTSRGEGFGLTIAETTACGVPVIGTDCSAITEVIGPGGVVVPGVAEMTNPYGVELTLADHKNIGMQLVALSRNAEYRSVLGAAGVAHVRKNFIWKNAAETFEALIEAALERQEAAT